LWHCVLRVYVSFCVSVFVLAILSRRFVSSGCHELVFWLTYVYIIFRQPESVLKVSPMAVTHAHLISYDLENDILPLCLANCKYTFKMGEGTKIQYDFSGLERQLIDKFLFPKSIIDVGKVLQVIIVLSQQQLYGLHFKSRLRILVFIVHGIWKNIQISRINRTC